jgi:hypothetical protein
MLAERREFLCVLAFTGLPLSAITAKSLNLPSGPVPVKFPFFNCPYVGGTASGNDVNWSRNFYLRTFVSYYIHSFYLSNPT